MRLEELRKTKRVELEGGAWVELYDELTAGDVDDIIAATKGGKEVQVVLPLTRLIAGWSFDDAVTEENVRKLPQRIVQRLIEEAGLEKGDFLASGG